MFCYHSCMLFCVKSVVNVANMIVNANMIMNMMNLKRKNKFCKSKLKAVFNFFYTRWCNQSRYVFTGFTFCLFLCQMCFIILIVCAFLRWDYLSDSSFSNASKASQFSLKLFVCSNLYSHMILSQNFVFGHTKNENIKAKWTEKHI